MKTACERNKINKKPIVWNPSSFFLSFKEFSKGDPMFVIETSPSKHRLKIFLAHRLDIFGFKVPLGKTPLATYSLKNTETPTVALDIHHEVTFETLGFIVTSFDLYLSVNLMSDNRTSYPVTPTNQTVLRIKELVDKTYTDEVEASSVTASALNIIMGL